MCMIIELTYCIFVECEGSKGIFFTNKNKKIKKNAECELNQTVSCQWQIT